MTADQRKPPDRPRTALRADLPRAAGEYARERADERGLTGAERAQFIRDYLDAEEEHQLGAWEEQQRRDRECEQEWISWNRRRLHEWEQERRL